MSPSSSIAIDQVYKPSVNCIAEEMDGELLVFNPDTVTTVHLDAPSTLVWRLCCEGNSVADIIEVLLDAYPDQQQQIHDDVIDIVQALYDKAVLYSESDQ